MDYAVHEISDCSLKKVITLIENITKDSQEKGPDYEWSLKDFEIGAAVGRGKFGRIYSARERNTGFVVAIKMLIKNELSRHRMAQQVINEINIQASLSHPYILPLFTHFDDERRVYLVLEYAAKGELYNYMQRQPYHRLDEKESAKFIYQVSDAVEYCHQNGVMHRDIKPENLLLRANGDVMLADFGWSINTRFIKRKTMCGTIDYLPPEMIENRLYDERVDHWCIGVLCYELICGQPPFETATEGGTFARIKQVDVKYPSFMSCLAKDLISKLLRYQPNKRLPIHKVKKHRWITINYLNEK